MNGIACPTCGATNHEVLIVRQRPGFTYRRRTCLECQGNFTTTERLTIENQELSTGVHHFADSERLTGILSVPPTKPPYHSQ